jgi:UDP-N-acetyl-D-mannosaminuronic acid dehydrogenase
LLADRDAVLICVDTPVDPLNIPRYEALRSALYSLGPVLKPGALVIVESTIAPRTMQDIVLPLLEKHSKLRLNEGFLLGNCPERVMPGRLLRNLTTVSRVVGGMTPETAEVMVELYQTIVSAELDPTDCLTAELVKTTENTYRDVQIAFANEVALICEAAGGDVWKVRELVNKSPGRQMHLPGGGVGGHCIPKDPWLLAYRAAERGARLRMIHAARAINDSMPLHVADLLVDALGRAGIQTQGARVLVMGYAYLEDSDDTRNSPSKTLVDRLVELGVEVSLHDPYVPDLRGPLEEAARGCQAAVVMVRHQDYVKLDLAKLKDWLDAPVLVDARRVFSTEAVERAGFVYRMVGVGGK